MKKKTIYIYIGKRTLDLFLSLFATILLFPIIIVIGILVKIKLGGPILFKQERPGKNEKIFKIYKFRTMTNEKDNKGDLLADEIRLTKFGKFLRATSLDELPELLNIIKGDMSIVGPRPLLTKDMWFMTEEQRKRHLVKPGLTGLAQIKGRNEISWEMKLEFDLSYIKKIAFFTDVKIILITIVKVFKKEGINEIGKKTATDLGDYLLENEKITKHEYEKIIKERK